MSESLSTTRLVRKLAPTVDVTCAGLKEPLQYRITRDVLPTFWAPRTTILASREDDIVSAEAAQAIRRGHGLGEKERGLVVGEAVVRQEEMIGRKREGLEVGRVQNGW